MMMMMSQCVMDEMPLFNTHQFMETGLVQRTLKLR